MPSHPPSTASAGREPSLRPAPDEPLLEVGWVLDDRLEAVDRRAVEGALDDVLARFRQALPGFEWHMPRLEREMLPHPTERPVKLLEAGSLELSLHHWDFVLVVTASDLASDDRPWAFAAVSRPLGAAVLSTFRVDPMERRLGKVEQVREELIRRRVERLAAFALGHLGGLGTSRQAGNPMAPPSSVTDLDGSADFDERQLQELCVELGRVADERIEEEGPNAPRGLVALYLRAAWRNRREIFHNVWDRRAWEFPFRMGRLTTAAGSALAILIATAESWEIGARLPAASIVLLAGASILGTGAYILRRQRLLALQHSVHPTEQMVVTRVSIVAFVMLGMLASYVLLGSVALVLGRMLVPPELLAAWLDADVEATAAMDYTAQATFLAALATLVGALGASFEGQSYVKHVAYVDMEV